MSDTQVKQPGAADELEELQKSLSGPDWLRSLRRDALAKYAATDWPTISEEEWRRSNLSAFEFDSYAHLASSAPETSRSEPSDSLAGVVRIHNGSVTDSAVTGEVAATGVRLLPLSEFLADSTADARSKVQSVLERSLQEADNRVQYWHFATIDEPIVLYVPQFVEVEDLFLVEYGFGGDEEYAVPHLTVVLEEGAKARIAKRILTRDSGEVLVNDGVDIDLADASSLHFVALQQLNDESLYFANGSSHVGCDSFVHCTEASLGADFVKSRFACTLDGDGADAVLNGLYFAVDEQHMDLRTVQRHMAPHTSSRAFYRGAVRDESHSIYQGLIQVDGAARGTDAYLTNKNLILGADARADSIPSLNINTDEVKCSHGSTTGKLDPAQLFYLQSRGFGVDEARKLLVQGYFEDIVAQCPDVMVATMRALIADRISRDDE